jgi:ADP-dependent NAD(P)H-hydrate dehydratase
LDTFTVDASFVARSIPPRRKDSHKGMNGTVCVVGGSRLYHGAPFLCASGALRCGVDLVYIAVPATVAPSVRSLSPDFIVIPLPDAKLTKGNVNRLMHWVPPVGCMAVGPGLGPQNTEHISYLVNQFRGVANGFVLDADALRSGVLPSAKAAGALVTPHAGEYERLFGSKPPDEVRERSEAVASKALESGVTVLLKGPTDIISDGKRVALNTTHSPSMTVGGTGDVLTGIAAALISKGVDTFTAACSAAFINGSAGLEAARDLGHHISASDVVARIPVVMKRFDRTV